MVAPHLLGRAGTATGRGRLRLAGGLDAGAEEAARKAACWRSYHQHVRTQKSHESDKATTMQAGTGNHEHGVAMGEYWPSIVIVPGCEHHPGRCKDDACGEQRVHHAHQIGVPWFVHTGRAAAGGSGHTRLTLSAWACYFTRVNLNTASQNNFACSLQNVFTQLKYDTASCPAPPRTSMLEHTPWVTCNDMRSAPLGPSAWNVDHGMTLCTSGPMAYTMS